jgi:hypothetical protein
MKCVDHPVSWLTLERYHLCELDPDEARKVAAHLETCPVCAACAESIAADHRVMPPLPEVTVPEKRPLLTWWRLVPALAAAMAALIIVLVRPFFTEDHPDKAPDRIAYRGGELAMTLVRERDGAIVENSDQYLSGDRFRLFATVPGNTATPWDVAVFQDGEVFFPLTPEREIGPGNNLPLPGAFRLTGTVPTEICLFIGSSLPGRNKIEREGKRALPETAVCRTLESVKGE